MDGEWDTVSVSRNVQECSQWVQMFGHAVGVKLLNSCFPRFQHDGCTPTSDRLHQCIQEGLLQGCDSQPAAWRHHTELNAGNKGGIAFVRIITNTLETENFRS